MAPFESNALNQYTRVNGSVYNYDGNFNLREAPNWGGVFDAQNRLVYGAHDGNGVYLTYDGLGRCVRRTVNYGGGGSSTTLFAYDGWKPTVEWDGAGNFQAWNIYGSGPDEILFGYQVGVGRLRYHYHQHWNVRFVLDWDCNRLEKYSYDGFGWPTGVGSTGADWD